MLGKRRDREEYKVREENKHVAMASFDVEMNSQLDSDGAIGTKKAGNHFYPLD